MAHRRSHNILSWPSDLFKESIFRIRLLSLLVTPKSILVTLKPLYVDTRRSEKNLSHPARTPQLRSNETTFLLLFSYCEQASCSQSVSATPLAFLRSVLGSPLFKGA